MPVSDDGREAQAGFLARAGEIIMDELQAYQRERTRAKDEKAEKGRSSRKDYLVRVVAAQLAVCIVLLVGAFLIVRTNPDAQKALRDAFDQMLSEDWTLQDAAAAFRQIGAFVFAPADAWPGADGQEAQTAQSAANTQAADGMGGVDETLFEGVKAPVDGATFAPCVVSVPVVRPVEGRVTSAFGYRIHPITNKLGFHRGMDIAAGEGTRIAAAYPGKVQEVGFSEGDGNYIKIAHANGLETTYCHCSEILAQEGVVVRAGETIALVGATGMATGPHLHIEVRLGGVLHNPAWLLGADNAYRDAV